MKKIKGPLIASAGADSFRKLAHDALRETMVIRVNGQNQIVYKDEIEKELYKSLYKQLNVGLKNDT